MMMTHVYNLRTFRLRFNNQVRRSTRVSRPPARLTDYVMLTDADEPSCYKEAMLASDHVKWEHAMQSELDNIHKNGTWELVPLPKDRKALPCKWVYKYKYTSDRTSLSIGRTIAAIVDVLLPSIRVSCLHFSVSVFIPSRRTVALCSTNIQQFSCR